MRTRVINSIGACFTGVVLIIVLVSKFVEGAWIAVVAMGVIWLTMQGIRRHYQQVAQELVLDPKQVSLSRSGHKPIVIVPLPGSHQWANAQAFARLGAIEVADQAALTADRLAERVLRLLDDEPRRVEMSRALAASMPRNAAAHIAHELLALQAS